MSTRCNVILSTKDRGGRLQSRIILYRHWDGYPSLTGENILSLLEKAKTRKVLDETSKKEFNDYCFSKLVHLFLDEPRDEEDSKLQYEITEMLHANIEHCYEIELRRHSLREKETYPSGDVVRETWVDTETLYHCEMDLSIDDFDEYFEENRKKHTLKTFSKLVEIDRGR